MAKKELLKAVASRAKLKAQQTNKAGAVVMDLAKPDGQYTKQIICVDCGAPRKVKPQDAWQVKRCVECQGKKKGAKLKQLIARKTDPVLKKDDYVKRRLARLDEWAKRSTAEVEDGFRRLAEFRARAAKEPKHKRIWP